MVVVFFKSIEHPGYYLVYRSRGSNVQALLQKMTHTGEHWDSGYDHINVEYSHQFTAEFDYYSDFFDYIIENIPTNHIPHPVYNDRSFKAWYEFKTYEPDKWIRQYEEFQKVRYQNTQSKPTQCIQQTLF